MNTHSQSFHVMVESTIDAKGERRERQREPDKQTDRELDSESMVVCDEQEINETANIAEDKESTTVSPCNKDYPYLEPYDTTAPRSPEAMGRWSDTLAQSRSRRSVNFEEEGADLMQSIYLERR